MEAHLQWTISSVAYCWRLARGLQSGVTRKLDKMITPIQTKIKRGVGHLRFGGGGGWHKALVVGSVSLWRRLLASRL